MSKYLNVGIVLSVPDKYHYLLSRGRYNAIFIPFCGTTIRKIPAETAIIKLLDEIHQSNLSELKLDPENLDLNKDKFAYFDEGKDIFQYAFKAGNNKKLPSHDFWAEYFQSYEKFDDANVLDSTSFVNAVYHLDITAAEFIRVNRLDDAVVISDLKTAELIPLNLRFRQSFDADQTGLLVRNSLVTGFGTSFRSDVLGVSESFSMNVDRPKNADGDITILKTYLDDKIDIRPASFTEAALNYLTAKGFVVTQSSDIVGVLHNKFELFLIANLISVQYRYCIQQDDSLLPADVAIYNAAFVNGFKTLGSGGPYGDQMVNLIPYKFIADNSVALGKDGIKNLRRSNLVLVGDEPGINSVGDRMYYILEPNLKALMATLTIGAVLALLIILVCFTPVGYKLATWLMSRNSFILSSIGKFLLKFNVYNERHTVILNENDDTVSAKFISDTIESIKVLQESNNSQNFYPDKDSLISVRHITSYVSDYIGEPKISSVRGPDILQLDVSGVRLFAEKYTFIGSRIVVRCVDIYGSRWELSLEDVNKVA